MSESALWVAGLEEYARTRLPPALFEYVVQGARDSITAREAPSTWQAVRLSPRVLRDVTTVDTSVKILGQRQLLPWGVAPTTLQRAIHPEGELAMARAVAAADGLLVVSSNAGTAFSDIASTGVRWWVQCYLPAERSLAVPLLQRAVQAGAEAVVLTLDTPVVGAKYAAADAVWDAVDPAILRVNFDHDYDTQPGSHKALDLSAHDIAWLGDMTGLPVVVKGVLRAEDAQLCVRSGAAAVWVSNHGGRQLERVVSTASALPEVVMALAGKAQVYVDGGLRTGLDIVTALALGADAVFLGRQPLYALVDGEEGVGRLHAELLLQSVESMRLIGAQCIDDTRANAPQTGLATP